MSTPTENYSLAEVAGLIADSVLQEKMLSKDKIITKVLVYAKAFGGIKQDPSKRPNPAGLTRTQRMKLRAEAQAEFWHNVVKKMCTDFEMLKLYSSRDKMLIEKGFEVGHEKVRKNISQ